MENEKPNYLKEKVKLRDILQAIANIAILFIAFELWQILTAMQDVGDHLIK